MTNDPRSDARLRAALMNLPGPDVEQTREALDRVLTTSRRGKRFVRYAAPLAVAAVVLAVLALLPALLPRADDRPTSPAGPDAVAVEGTWQRAVSGAVPVSWEGTWRITFDSRGVLAVAPPDTARLRVDGASYRVDGGRLVVDPFANDVCNEIDPGIYRWQLEGRSLVLTVVNDQCVERVAVVEGTWRAP